MAPLGRYYWCNKERLNSSSRGYPSSESTTATATSYKSSVLFIYDRYKRGVGNWNIESSFRARGSPHVHEIGNPLFVSTRHVSSRLFSPLPIPSSLCLLAMGTTPSTLQESSSSTQAFQTIFEKALKEYKKKTGKDLTTHPLAAEINGCTSPEAILAVLERKAGELNRSQSSDERLTKWLDPTVNILNALSATLGQGVGLVSYSNWPRYSSLPLHEISGIPPYHNHLLRDRDPPCGEFSYSSHCICRDKSIFGRLQRALWRTARC